MWLCNTCGQGFVREEGEGEEEPGEGQGRWSGAYHEDER